MPMRLKFPHQWNEDMSNIYFIGLFEDFKKIPELNNVWNVFNA